MAVQERVRNYEFDCAAQLVGFAISCRSRRRIPPEALVSMEDVDTEPKDEILDVQTCYASIINDFRSGLLQWLEKDVTADENDVFEDRDLDRLLLAVIANALGLSNSDRTISRATQSA